MMKPVTRFKQIDVTRAVKAVEAAGLRVGRIEIDPNGKIVILTVEQTKGAESNEWDNVL